MKPKVKGHGVSSLPLRYATLWERSGKTETEDAAPFRGLAPEAPGRAHVLRSVEPRATTQHALLAASAITVFHPFTHVAAHVVQAVAVRLLLAYGVGLVAAVAVIPRHRVDIAAAAVFALAATVAGVFPFRFTGQAVLFAGLLV